MSFLKKIFNFPGPRELGMSTRDALPLRAIQPNTIDFCWEDWEEEIKKRYPIKFWLLKTCPTFIRYKIWFPIKRSFADIYDWLYCHIIKRDHILDLRQPCKKNDAINIDCYRYGWVDIVDKIKFANFNLLNKFVEEELNLLYFPSEEEVIEDPNLKKYRDLIIEIKSIYNWWNFDRQNETQDVEDKTDEMLIRLIKIRQNLWT